MATRLKDKLIGKTKELVAEINGDGKLAEEGKRQQADQRAPADRRQGPLENLKDLT